MGKIDWNSRPMQIAVSLLAIVLLFVLPFFTGCTIPMVGKITFSWLQLFYGVLSLDLAVAVYVWGVGNWSRFEPPPILDSSLTPQSNEPAQGPPPKPVTPVQLNAAPQGQPPGAPPAPQGGH
jgi:hypothetical protein